MELFAEISISRLQKSRQWTLGSLWCFKVQQEHYKKSVNDETLTLNAEPRKENFDRRSEKCF